LRACHTSFNFVPAFIYSFVILPEGESSKVSLGHEMHLDNDFFIRHKHGRNNFSFCVIFTQNETSVFRRSPAAETGTVNVILTTASLPDFRAKIVQSLHKMTPPTARQFIFTTKIHGCPFWQNSERSGCSYGKK
jgi:hypothetical protein